MEHCKESEILRSPVLLIVFARPACTKETFRAVRHARPKRLYVAADGPRAANHDERMRSERVRRIVEQIDWECDLRRRFSSDNLGCRLGPQYAIDWFFENEEEGIILEDDCVPEPDFFRYCDWALKKYRDVKEVWHIGGNNFAAPPNLYENADVVFTSLPQVWGWATWRDRWHNYPGNPFYLEEHTRPRSDNWKLSLVGKWNKLGHLELLKRGLNTWDYEWQITVLNHQGLCISSRSNLVRNIGDGEGATHTVTDRRTHLETAALDAEKLHAPKPHCNRRLTAWFEKNTGLRNYKGAVVCVGNRLGMNVKASLKRRAARLLFGGTKPIVVASTGRSGSTMLFNAIAAGLVRHRFGLTTNSWLGWLIADIAKVASARLSQIPGSSIPVHKTHDCFNPGYEREARYVFVYGDPLESASSVDMMVRKEGRIWLDEHLYNLKSDGRFEDLYEKDILGYKTQLESWSKGAREYVYMVHYDDLWKEVDRISDFLGFAVQLADRKPRQSKVQPKKYNNALFEDLRAIMADVRSADGIKASRLG